MFRIEKEKSNNSFSDFTKWILVSSLRRRLNQPPPGQWAYMLDDFATKPIVQLCKNYNIIFSSLFFSELLHLFLLKKKKQPKQYTFLIQRKLYDTIRICYQTNWISYWQGIVYLRLKKPIKIQWQNWMSCVNAT